MEENSPLINWYKTKYTNSKLSPTSKKDVVSNLGELNTLLFLSVLKGEYYRNDFENTLNKINDYIHSITLSESNIIETKIKLEKLIPHYNTFFNGINYNLDKIEDVTNSNNIELDFIYKNYGFIFNLQNKSDELEAIYTWLFAVNLKISVFDEGYVVNKENIIQLSEIYNLISRLDSYTNEALDPIIKKTKLRCALLLYKILRRKLKSLETNYNISEDYKINNIDKEKYTDSYKNKISDLEEFITDNGGKILIKKEVKTIVDNIEKIISEKEEKTIIEIIDNHYKTRSIKSSEEIEKINQKIIDKKVTVEDVIFFTKHYRKKEKFEKWELKRVRNIKDELLLYFENKRNQRNILFINKSNDYPYATVKEHLNNLSLKLFCDEEIKKLDLHFNFKNLQKSFKNIKGEYFNIEESAKDGIKFPSFIIKKTIIESLKKLLEIVKSQSKETLNDEKSGFYELIKQIFYFIYETSNKLETAVTYWEENRLMPIYVEIEECNKSVVFLDSYYVLPSDYLKVLETNKFNISEVKKLETIFYYLLPDNIREEYKKAFKSEVKDYQFSVITIIGLYAGFITYVLGNISLLKVFINHSIGSVLAFMLIFGVVMAFFIISLKLLFSEKQKERKVFLFIWLFAILIMIIVALWQIGELNSSHISSELKEQIKNPNG